MRVPDLREVYEMVTQQKPPDPGALDRQRTRQIRTTRHRKIGTFLVVAAMGLATIALVVGTRGQPGEDAPQNPPAANPEGTVSEVVARKFVGAIGALDANQALAHLSDDADVSGVVTSLGGGLDGRADELPRLMSMLDAMGYRQRHVSCDETARSPSSTTVRCTFAFHLLGSFEFGRASFGGSYFDLVVHDGRIVRASIHWNTERFSPQMWDPFARWVFATHPGDAALMYEDATHGAARVTTGSIRLWTRHVRTWVDEVGSIRAAPVGRVSAVVDGLPLSFQVPSSGWELFGTVSLNKSVIGPQGAEAIVYWTSLPDGPVAEACFPFPGSDSGPDAVAVAVARAPGTELTSGPSNVTVGGYPAKHVGVIVNEDAGCDPGYFFTWPDIRWGALWPETRIGYGIDVWIVGVDGRRLFIAAELNDDLSDGAHRQLETEIHRIIDSIRFG
jgi:hypothetical protein